VVSHRRLVSHWEPAFFGLGTEAREVFLEHAFALQYYMGMSYSDCKNLPLRYRMWFIDRLTKELERKRNAIAESTADANKQNARRGTKRF